MKAQLNITLNKSHANLSPVNVINKAVVERWTTKEIQRMIDNIKCKYKCKYI